MIAEIGKYHDVAEFSLVHTDGLVAYSSSPEKVGRRWSMSSTRSMRKALQTTATWFTIPR
ncbi:MAG: hypothetical protein LRY50_07180 [Geovibrio sp.]|nr:hypothetical protein [Geovibrio sp.]